MNRRFEFLQKYSKRIREFDYTSLSFLYVACLVTIAFVFTIFRVSQHYLEKREEQALSSIELILQQRELLGEFERLIAQAQNRTSPAYAVNTRNLLDAYSHIAVNHAQLGAKLQYIRSRCGARPCSILFHNGLFERNGVNTALLLTDNKLSLNGHNKLLQDLFDLAVDYRLILKEAQALAFDTIHKKNEAALRFDFIAYFSLLILLIVQAIYIFRPAVRRLSASLTIRSDFLSRISHEIRNPMNSIIGMADILKGTKLNYEQQQYVDNLIRSGHALLDMLNNLIDSSAIEGGKLSLKSAYFDLFRTVDRCLHLVSLQAHHKNINIYLQISPEVSQRLVGDSVRLEQVLINLLNNAVKFTDQGHVLLSVDVMMETEDSVTLEFAVEDTGIGIKSDQLGEIFESFVQGDSSIKRRYGGSGLGLSIASEIIRMMGGELQVSSEFGQGSRFYFTTTFAKQYSVERRPPLKVLESSNLLFLVSGAEIGAYRKQFQKLGLSGSILSSSQEMRAYLARSSATSTQVLIDDSIGIISMITCRHLADENGLGDRTVALIRANFTKENMDLLRRNGFTRFLIKPLKPWDLLTLPQYVPDTPQRAASLVGGPEIVAELKEKNLRVLLVDDSNDNLFLLKEVIGPVAANIHFAENGLEALEKFSANSYDVIFMDIQMPVMDGYTAIRKIREIERQLGRTIPVFAVTAHAGLVDAQKCREAGFTDRIVKPVVRSDIYKSLARAFQIESATEERPSEESEIPAKYLAKLMPSFFKAREQDMARLRNAIEAFDYETIQQLGHKMKGSSASYGFQDASLISHRLEQSAKTGDSATCQTLAGELNRIFEQERANLDL